jgi:hypothetical protein
LPLDKTQMLLCHGEPKIKQELVRRPGNQRLNMIVNSFPVFYINSTRVCDLGAFRVALTLCARLDRMS